MTDESHEIAHPVRLAQDPAHARPVLRWSAWPEEPREVSAAVEVGERSRL